MDLFQFNNYNNVLIILSPPSPPLSSSFPLVCFALPPPDMFKKVLEFTMTPAGIDTAKLYPILMSSGLPREALGQIWASANRTTPGMLTKEELYTVLALIGVAQVSVKEGWEGPKHSLGITPLIIRK